METRIVKKYTQTFFKKQLETVSWCILYQNPGSVGAHVVHSIRSLLEVLDVKSNNSITTCPFVFTINWRRSPVSTRNTVIKTHSGNTHKVYFLNRTYLHVFWSQFVVVQMEKITVFIEDALSPLLPVYMHTNSQLMWLWPPCKKTGSHVNITHITSTISSDNVHASMLVLPGQICCTGRD